MRVIIADDEKPCLEDLIYMLSSHADVEITGAFTRSEDALAAVPDLQPDALFLDLSMPHMNGVELAKQILAEFPGTKIVFVTAFVGELADVRDVPIFASLLKPVDDVRLKEVLERLRENLPA